MTDLTHRWLGLSILAIDPQSTNLLTSLMSWPAMYCWKSETQISAQLQQNNEDSSKYGKKDSLLFLEIEHYRVAKPFSQNPAPLADKKVTEYVSRLRIRFLRVGFTR